MDFFAPAILVELIQKIIYILLVEKRELLEFCLNNTNIIHECDYEAYTGKAPVVYCMEVLNEEDAYTLKIGINKNGKLEEHLYIAKYLEDKWNVEEI